VRRRTSRRGAILQGSPEDGAAAPGNETLETTMTTIANRLAALALVMSAFAAANTAQAGHPVHGPGSSHNPIIFHPVHGPGSSHNPIIVHPVHGLGSSHDPIICRPGARPGSLDCRHDGGAR